MRFHMNKKISRLQLLNEFESAPNSALFNQQTLAAFLDCSTQLLERNRWEGKGVPYLKIGRKVLYRKNDAAKTLLGAIKDYSSSIVIIDLNQKMSELLENEGV